MLKLAPTHGSESQSHSAVSQGAMLVFVCQIQDAQQCPTKISARACLIHLMLVPQKASHDGMYDQHVQIYTSNAACPTAVCLQGSLKSKA